jgi:hypothetical protein
MRWSAVDAKLAEDYLRYGCAQLLLREPGFIYRQRYYEGDHDEPFAPEGVNLEYKALQRQAIASYMAIAMNAPVQRMKPIGMRLGDGSMDEATWKVAWQGNNLDSRCTIPFTQMMVHGRGIWSVSKNPKRPKVPLIRPENVRRVYLHPSPDDPFTTQFAVKVLVEPKLGTPGSGLWTPSGAEIGRVGDKQVGFVYDDTMWMRFEKTGLLGQWQYVDEGLHGLGQVPFVPSDNNVDADGVPHAAIDHLIPQQDALNTIRFDTLLAMQFSAYRQRVFTGYDPVAKDEQGRPILRMNPDGSTVLDPNGRPVPVLNSPGRIGVDRALVFPGADTKVFDLQESNLKNYIEVYSAFLTDLFAIGQIPPQYMLTRMANLSGDALTGAESTLQSLVAELQAQAGESLATAIALGRRAIGSGRDDDTAIQIIWGDGEARSFAQVVDAIVKLISTGFPKRAAFEMIPGATPPKVTEWMKQIDDEAGSAVLGHFVEKLAVSGGASTGGG